MRGDTFLTFVTTYYVFFKVQCIHRKLIYYIVILINYYNYIDIGIHINNGNNNNIYIM
jgi:hypothetical protein